MCEFPAYQSEAQGFKCYLPSTFWLLVVPRATIFRGCLKYKYIFICRFSLFLPLSIDHFADNTFFSKILDGSLLSL